MSTPPSTDRLPAPGPRAGAFDLLYRKYRASRLTTPLEAAGFWAAIALPFVYLAILLGVLAGGLILVAQLLALNAVALVVGHGHNRDD